MNNPKPEHRISFLEKQFLALGGNIEELKEDIETLDQGMKASFDKIGDAFTLLDGNIEAVKATMATKDDIARLESDITSIKNTQEQILKLLQQKPVDSAE